jgi:hypothetical protein
VHEEGCIMSAQAADAVEGYKTAVKLEGSLEDVLAFSAAFKIPMSTDEKYVNVIQARNRDRNIDKALLYYKKAAYKKGDK